MKFDLLDPIGSLTKLMVDGAVESWKTTASWALNAGNVTTAQWQTAFDVVNKVAGVMGFIAVLVGVVGIVQEAFKGSLGGVVSTVFRTILAWPITVVLINVTVRALAVEGGITNNILHWAFGDKVEITFTLTGAGLGSMNSIVAMLLALLIILGSLVLMLMMAARTFLIILGIGLSPIVTMINSWSVLRASLSKWGSWMAGVILFKPICAIIIYLCGALMKGADGQMFGYLTAVVGMILASVTPWVIVKMVATFLPAGVGLRAASSAGHSTVSGAVDVAKTAAAAAIGAGTMLAGAGAGAGTVGAGATASTGTSGLDGVTDKTTEGIGDIASSKDKKTASDDSTEKNDTESPTATSSAISGLKTGSGAFASISQFMQGMAGTGIAPSGVNSTLSAAGQVSEIVNQVRDAHSPAAEYTKGQADSATTPVIQTTGGDSGSTTTLIHTTPAAVPPSVPSQTVVQEASASKSDVNVHVSVDSSTPASVNIDK
ncbi:hypothetical protein ACFQY8_07705 [Alloscardovia venturai]|uniref:TrbL/VirB6 plasmid conjugal transfer protein n=1 Tax=Alloscardovia venturai TaxID=1769421 RepID=A0ABW2Y8C2_9BIFI